MLRVGITGGIGSGKSVVCQVFQTLGIPVFNADEAAKYLMEHDTALMNDIQSLLGKGVYVNGKIDRVKVAELVFADRSLLGQLNKLVHPATIAYADDWMEKQTAPYVIKEAAIFFESGSNTEVQAMIGVYAPKELRITRAMNRSNLTWEKVLSIMNNQMDEDEKMGKCDYVITNDDQSAVIPQVLKLHQLFLNRSSAS